MSLRIPLTHDQTLQVEFHEIERRLRRLERASGVSPASGQNVVINNSSVGGGTSVNLQPILDRLTVLEQALAGLSTTSIPNYGPVGASARNGLVPSPGLAESPEGVAQHVLTEDNEWGFPLRGLIGVSTSGDQTDPPNDVVNINAGLQVQALTAADIECYGLHTHGQVEYDDTFWEDLRFPSQGINPAGSPAPAGVDTATGALSFSGTIDNVIGGFAQLPHSWLPGSTVRPHLHLRFPTSAAANTRWQFRYDVASINSDYANAVGTYTSLSAVTVANPANTAKHVIASLGDLPMTGQTESCIIMWQVWRLANSDAADNDTNACFLLEFDIHFQIVKPGSNNEIP